MRLFSFFNPHAASQVRTQLLTDKNFTAITSAGWEYIICSLVDEAYQSDFLGDVPRINFRNVEDIMIDRELSLEGSVMRWLKFELMPTHRKDFVSAFSALAKRSFELAVKGNEETHTFLGLLLKLPDSHVILNGDVALAIAVQVGINPAIRGMAAQALVNRDFANSIPQVWWDDIERRQMHTCWPLAYAVLSRERREDPLRMLDVLAEIGENVDTPDGVESQNLHFTVNLGFSDVRSLSSYQASSFREGFKRLSPKMLVVVRDALMPNSPLRELLPPSAAAV